MRSFLQNAAIAALCVSGSSALHIDANNSTSVAYRQTAGEAKTRVPPAVHVPPPHPTVAPNSTHSSTNSTHGLMPTDLSKTDHDHATYATLTAGQTDLPTAAVDHSSTATYHQSDIQQQTSAPIAGNGGDKTPLQLWQAVFAAFAALYWA